MSIDSARTSHTELGWSWNSFISAKKLISFRRGSQCASPHRIRRRCGPALRIPNARPGKSPASSEPPRRCSPAAPSPTQFEVATIIIPLGDPLRRKMLRSATSCGANRACARSARRRLVRKAVGLGHYQVAILCAARQRQDPDMHAPLFRLSGRLTRRYVNSRKKTRVTRAFLCKLCDHVQEWRMRMVTTQSAKALRWRLA
jgi:hypothetical protein